MAGKIDSVGSVPESATPVDKIIDAACPAALFHRVMDSHLSTGSRILAGGTLAGEALCAAGAALLLKSACADKMVVVESVSAARQDLAVGLDITTRMPAGAGVQGAVALEASSPVLRDAAEAVAPIAEVTQPLTLEARIANGQKLLSNTGSFEAAIWPYESVLYKVRRIEEPISIEHAGQMLQGDSGYLLEHPETGKLQIYTGYGITEPRFFEQMRGVDSFMGVSSVPRSFLGTPRLFEAVAQPAAKTLEIQPTAERIANGQRLLSPTGWSEAAVWPNEGVLYKTKFIDAPISIEQDGQWLHGDGGHLLQHPQTGKFEVYNGHGLTEPRFFEQMRTVDAYQRGQWWRPEYPRSPEAQAIPDGSQVAFTT